MLLAARSRTGRGGRRCARARTRSGSAASEWRARSGTAAAARPHTRGCGRLGRARERRHGDAGHRHGHAHRDGDDRREELGLPLDHVTVQVGDSARGPFASISGGSSTLPSMGPAVRSAAADAARQVVELAAQRFDRPESTLSLRAGNIVCSDGGTWPLADITSLLENGQILGKGSRGPNPTGMRVLTFGIQLAEVAVDVGTARCESRRSSRSTTSAG